MKKRILPILLGAGVLALSASAFGATQAAAPDPNAGAKLIQKNGCMGCHGAKLQGGSIGPSLYGIEHKLTDAQTVDFIKNPRSPMPDFGFSDGQIRDIVAYLSGLDGGLAGAPVVTVDPATPRTHATVTVRFTGPVPKRVIARVSMVMGTMSHHRDVELHPSSDPHVWQGRLEFAMGGSWTLSITYDGKHIDLPLNVAGGL